MTYQLLLKFYYNLLATEKFPLATSSGYSCETFAFGREFVEFYFVVFGDDYQVF